MVNVCDGGVFRALIALIALIALFENGCDGSEEEDDDDEKHGSGDRSL